MVEVNDAATKRKFQARTNMSWQEFADIAYDRFRKPRADVLIGYKFVGDSGGVIELTSELEWNNAIIRMKEKIKSARTRSVTMELRNMVSNVGVLDDKGTDLFFFGLQHISAKAMKSNTKGKAKRTRSDDVPPEPSQEMKHQQECLLDLRRHLRCTGHSMPGRPVYCWPKPGGKGSPGGHRELSHEDMTLWAKYIVSKMKCTVK